jgi:hypothetical protein
MGLLDILKHYSDPAAAPTSDVVDHFETVAHQADPEDLSQGIAAALRSDATPSFGQTIGSLFGQSNPSQKAGVLNEIIKVLGPAAAATAGGGILGRILSTNARGTPAPVSPEQAAQISPTELSAIAAQTEQQNDSIVDRLSRFYAQHPTLVKTLGVVAMGAVMSHMNNQQRRRV